MKTTENFYAKPEAVLQGVLQQQPAAVLVVAMDDHGDISVYSSHSTPITMLLSKRAIPTIMVLGGAEDIV